jgi:hypothetical protein
VKSKFLLRQTILKNNRKTRKLFDEHKYVFVDTAFDFYNAQIIGRYNLVMVVDLVTILDTAMYSGYSRHNIAYFACP